MFECQISCAAVGASTFMGLRKYVIEPSRTRVKCLLHLAAHGLAAAGLAAGGKVLISGCTIKNIDQKKVYCRVF